VRILKHCDEVWQARHYDLHEIELIRSFSDGSECKQRRVSFLPVGVLNICRHELNNGCYDIVANHLGDGSEAASGRKSYSKFVILLIFIFNVDSLNGVNKKLNKLCTAL